jgi:hypothetical protein
VAGRSKLLHNYLFQALLAERRTVLCNDLDDQTTKLAWRERSGDSAGIRLKRLRIKEIGAWFHYIDRMVQRLMVRLLGIEQ